MTIAVIGSGRVGLVVGACLAGAGHRVACADMDRALVERLARGEIAFVEPGLGPLVRTGIGSGRLSFTTDASAAVRGAAVFSSPSRLRRAPTAGAT